MSEVNICGGANSVPVPVTLARLCCDSRPGCEYRRVVRNGVDEVRFCLLPSAGARAPETGGLRAPWEREC